MEGNFLAPAPNQVQVGLGGIAEVDREMLEKLNPFLERYFTREEVEYIKTGNQGNLQFVGTPEVDAARLFTKYFPIFRDRGGSTPEERKEPQRAYYGTTDDIATKLEHSDSPYFGGERHEYKGNIATPVIMRIIRIIRNREGEGQRSLIRKDGFFRHARQIPTFCVGNYSIRLAKREEYLDGLPLFLGELAKTCQVIGKSGGHYGLDYLLNPYVETLVFTKNIIDGNSVREVVVGSPAICRSSDNRKIIISAIELVNTPTEIASALIRGMAQALYEEYRGLGIEEVQVGIGARTLHDLGYNKFVDGGNGCYEYNKVRAETATQADLEIISQIAKGMVPARTEAEHEPDANVRNLQLQSKLFCSPLRGDADDIRPRNSVLKYNRDVRYRLSLCDAATSGALNIHLIDEKNILDITNPSVFKRCGDIIKSRCGRLDDPSPDILRKGYFRE